MKGALALIVGLFGGGALIVGMVRTAQYLWEVQPDLMNAALPAFVGLMALAVARAIADY